MLTLIKIYVNIFVFYVIPQVAFSFFYLFLASSKIFSLMQSHLLLFAIVAYAFSVKYKKKITAKTNANEHTSMFSFRNVMGFRSYFKSSVHFELIFIYGVRERSSFFLFCFVSVFVFACGCLVFPTPIIKKAILPPLYILGPFVLN